MCLSQAQPSSGAPDRARLAKEKETIIPETLFDIDGMSDGLLFLEDGDNVLLKTPATGDEIGPLEDTCTEKLGGKGHEVRGIISQGTEMPTLEPAEGGADKDILQISAVAPTESPVGKTKNGEQAGACSTRRQVAMQNTLCPSPGVNSGPATETVIQQAVKKVAMGRGRSSQSATVSEKGCNMKPFTHFGLQEKFRAPAVVSEGSKGRGRGGKPVKRKRDAH